MTDVDEALVSEIGAMVEDISLTRTGRSISVLACDEIARAVLAHLAATGRLVGEGEERVEWSWSDSDDPERRYLADEAMVMRMVTDGFVGMTGWRRTVRTWTTPDEATGTLVGPWVEVEG